MLFCEILNSLKFNFADDIGFLILQHYCANIIRYKWIRFQKYGHSRKPTWQLIRPKINTEDWRVLHNYSSIRREWRVENIQWLVNTDRDIENIKIEAEIGLWGKPDNMFIFQQSVT